MMNRAIQKEIITLESITNKNHHELRNYYHKCYNKIPFNSEYSTQFEFNESEEKANDIILALIRDYALFDEDNSDLLRGISLDDEDLFNCCSPYRL